MRLKDIVNVFSEAAHEVSTKSNDEFPTLVKYNNVLYMKKFKNQISICDYTKKNGAISFYVSPYHNQLKGLG